MLEKKENNIIYIYILSLLVDFGYSHDGGSKPPMRNRPFIPRDFREFPRTDRYFLELEHSTLFAHFSCAYNSIWPHVVLASMAFHVQPN